MRNLRRQFVLGVVAGAIGFVAAGQWGCSVEPTSTAPSDVIYQGGATENALVALLKAPAVEDATQAATFTWTSNGDTFPASTPLTFCWTSVAGARAEPHEVDPRRVFHAGAAVPADEGKLTFDRVLSKAGEALFTPLLSGESVAYANGSPLTGKAYFFVLSTSKDPKLLRVFTTSHDYTPDAAGMKKLAAAGEPIQAVVTTAYFNLDAITKAGGPFKGNAVTFTITP